MPQERRILTILFCDLKGFTTLSESMDPEDIQEIISDLFQTFRRLIEEQGGLVDKFMGDSVMAVFGATRAHEDDPLRTVRTGLAMQEHFAAFNRKRGLDLSLRVGINTGNVLWGEVAGDRPTAIGDAVNVAQRLETACEPGKVLVSPSVEAATRKWIEYRRLDGLTVKGRQAPVQPYEVTGLAKYTPAYREVAGITAPFLGREEPMQRLHELFRAGRPAFVLYEGEAGVGKSRFVWEFRQQVAAERPGESERPALFDEGVGRCQYGVPLPLEPFAQILQKCAGIDTSDPEAAEAIARRILRDFEDSPHDEIERENYAHLMTLSIGLDVPDARVKFVEPRGMLQEVRHAWHMWLRAVARKAPVVLVVEDLHWADEGTVGLLEYFAARLSDERVLMIATRRPEGKAPVGFELLRLEPLEPDVCRGLAEQVLVRQLTEGVTQFLVEKTAGNPYYVEELLRYLMENELLDGDPAVLRTREIRVPQTLQGLLIGRIDALGPREKDVIKAASVVGRIFWRTVLKQALEKEVQKEIEQLEQLELVFERGESQLPGEVEFAFKHALLRDAAYSLLTRRDREKLHTTLAEVLQQGGNTRARVLSAGHWEAAGDRERAQQLFAQAAEEFYERSAFEETVEYASRARAPLLRARALSRLSRYEEALVELRHLMQSPELAPEEKARAQVEEASVRNSQGHPVEALAAVDSAIASLPAGVDRCKALSIRGWVLLKLGQLDESLGVAREAIASSRKLLEADPGRDTRKALATAFTLLSNGKREQGLHDEALEASQESHRINQEMGDLQGVAVSLTNVGLAHWGRGAYEEAFKAFEEALVISRQIGARKYASANLNNLGILHQERGDYRAALETYEKALTIKREIGDLLGVAKALNNIGEAHSSQGSYAAALRAYEESVAITRQAHALGYLAICLNSLGNVQQILGNCSEAVIAQEESLRLASELGNPVIQASAMLSMGRLYGATDQPEKAEPLFEKSISICEAHGSKFELAEALIERARARLDQDLAEARQDVQRARRFSEELKLNVQAVKALSTLARLEALEGRRSKALEMMREAGSRAAKEGDIGVLLQLEEDNAAVHIALGEHARGAELARAGARLAAEKGHRMAERRFLMLLSKASGDLREEETARTRAVEIETRFFRREGGSGRRE